MIFGLFGKKRRERPEERADVPPGDDPVRRILAVPRGIARLDAFEEALKDLEPGTHGHRGVALAFHRELTSLAEKAEVDLSLLSRRVEACAEALQAAGEVERAGVLLARIGKRRRAAELFVAAGAIAELEEAHAALDDKEGGPHLSARLAYERFEGLFAVGLRKEALAALEEAARLWPENPIYGEIAERFSSRVMRGALFLEVELGQAAQRRAVSLRVVPRWPLIIGRKDDAALRVTSPLVSREHLEVSLEGGRPQLRDLMSRAGTLVDGRPLEGSVLLEGRGRIELGGVELGYEVDGEALVLFAAHARGARTVGVLSRRARVRLDEAPNAPSLPVSFDAEDRAYLEPDAGLTMNGERVTRPLLLLEGDRVRGEGYEARVVHDG